MGVYRLFLAIVVAYDHWRAIILRPIGRDDLSGIFGFDAGHAVLLFYVISGFLITYTLTHNYSDDAIGRWQFYKNRFVRIFSVYWPMAAISALFFTESDLGTLSVVDLLTRVLVIGQDWSVAFRGYPQAGDFSGTMPLLHQSWTLGAELTFYLFAPFLLQRWRVALVLLVGSLFIRVCLVGGLGNAQAFPTWTYFFFPSTVFFFMLGHFACVAAKRFNWLLNKNLALLAPTILVIIPCGQIGVYLLGIDATGFDNPIFWISLVLFVVTLPALFDATKKIEVMNYLGNLSYPVYLIHTFVLSLSHTVIVQHILPAGSGATAICYLILVLVAAIIAHELIEKPVASLMRHLFSKRVVSTQQA